MKKISIKILIFLSAVIAVQLAKADLGDQGLRNWTLSNSTDSVGATQAGTWTVNSSGTSTVTQGTSPWVNNISQFGGTNLSTGTGASGSGIPRVTVANDSNILATQSGTWTTGRTWSLLNSTDSVNAVQSGAWTTGRTWSLSSGTDSVAATQSGTWTVQQGSTPTSVGNAWPVKLTDGTNTTAVKAASTAAVAADPSTVVSLSPNSPVPTGTNSIGQVTANAGTNLNTSALALSATQTNGTQKTQVVDVSGNIYSTTDGSTSGSITASGQSITLALPEGTSSTELQLSGTFVGTVVFESTIDGTTFNARVYRGTGILNMLSTGTSTFPSEWRGNSAGMTSIRVRSTAFTSGTLSVAIRSSRGVGALFLNAAIPIGGQSAGNSSTASLAAAGVFTGTYEDLSNVASVGMSLLMSQSGTLQTQFSQDGSTLYNSTSYSVTANVPFSISVPPLAQYLRLVVTNTSVSTATVGLETLYRAVGLDLTRLPLGSGSNLTDATIAPVNRSILAGRVAVDTYTDVKVDTSGNVGTIVNDKSATGTIAATNGAVSVSTNGSSSVYANITGTWVGTLVAEVQDANGAWNQVGFLPPLGTLNSQTTVNVNFFAPVGGAVAFRVRASIYTSGTVNVALNSGIGNQAVQVFNLGASSLRTSSNLFDGSSNAITSTTDGAKQRLDVSASSKVALTGNAPATVTCGVASGVAVASNSSRKGLVLTNTSINRISFHINNGTAVLNSGITLLPGGIWTMDEFTYTTSAINCIASLAGSTLAIQELQ